MTDSVHFAKPYGGGPACGSEKDTLGSQLNQTNLISEVTCNRCKRTRLFAESR